MSTHRVIGRLAALGAPVLGLALVLAACNGGTPTTSPTVTPPSGGTVPRSVTTTTTTLTGTPAPGTITTAPSGPSRCRVTQLSAKPGPPNGATGHIGQVVTFKNTSASTCTLDGYPGLGMLGSSSQAIPTNVLRTPSVVVQAESPAPVKLKPGGQASFTLGYADQTGFGSSTCPASVNLEVTPPNDYSHLVIPDRISAYGPSVGQCGAINVSPVYPGTGSQP
ncbi:MAG: DUF4232 domain-containing protein [Acidimicrobiales bacterium]